MSPTPFYIEAMHPSPGLRISAISMTCVNRIIKHSVKRQLALLVTLETPKRQYLRTNIYIDAYNPQKLLWQRSSYSKTLVYLVVNAKIKAVDSLYKEGILTTQENWAFLARFCFLSHAGRFLYELEYPTDFAVQNLYLYYDSEDQWPTVYRSDKTCEQRESVLHREGRQIVNLSTWSLDEYNWPGCHLAVLDNKSWLKCSHYRNFVSVRDRWWYIAMGNCNSTKGLYLKYKLFMTNGNPGDMWHYHFSADEFYILLTNIGFLVLDSLLLAVSAATALILKSRQMFHVTFKLYLSALVLECVSLFFSCVHYGRFASNGQGIPLCKLFGQISRVLSSLQFLLLLILIGKGYTVTRGRLSKKGRLRISIFMTIYTLTYISLFISQELLFDPGEVTYFYEGIGGYLLMVIRVIGWVWFLYAVYFTLIHYPEKRAFYVAFACLYSIWFWMGPFVMLISSHFIGAWMREKIVNGVENAISFLGFLGFLYLTRPSSANTNFPYHCRTTQVHIANSARSDNASFPHNTYEPSKATVNYSVFSVDNSADIASPKVSIITDSLTNMRSPPPPYAEEQEVSELKIQDLDQTKQNDF